MFEKYQKCNFWSKNERNILWLGIFITQKLLYL